MNLGKTVGEILKESREAIRMSPQEVARETNITLRFIEALENDDWGQFPGEPYAMGFLKNYAEYLKLNPEELISIYKGAQINEMAPPLEELTRATDPLIQINPKIIMVAAAALAVIVGSYFLFSSDFISKIITSSGSTEENNVTPFRDYKIVPHVFDQGDSTFILFSKKDGRTINVRGQDVNLLFMDVKDYQASEDSSGSLVLGVNFYPDNEVLPVKLTVGQPVTLSYSDSRFQKLNQNLLLEVQSLKSSSARLKVVKGQARPGSIDETPDESSTGGTMPISVRFKFSGSSWCKFTVDDKEYNPGTIEAGETKHYMANNRLEARIGNGGVVEYSLNGEDFKKVGGQVGKSVLKKFIRTTDPYDPSQKIIQVQGE